MAKYQVTRHADGSEVHEQEAFGFTTRHTFRSDGTHEISVFDGDGNLSEHRLRDANGKLIEGEYPQVSGWGY